MKIFDNETDKELTSVFIKLTEYEMHTLLGNLEYFLKNHCVVGNHFHLRPENTDQNITFELDSDDGK